MTYEIKVVDGERKAKVGIYKPCNAKEIEAVIKHVSGMIESYSNTVNELIDNEERIDDSFLNHAMDAVVKFSEELKALKEAKEELESEEDESESSVVCEKVGDWTVTLNKEAYESDPHTIESNTYRYNLNYIWGSDYVLWDNVKKENLIIKGDKRWEKWSKEHRKEYCTDF